jgi:hypothetical protein
MPERGGQQPMEQPMDISSEPLELQQSEPQQSQQQSEPPAVAATAEEHYGWKEWGEDAVSEGRATTHVAICDAGDGTVWTRATSHEARGEHAEEGRWNESLPLFCSSAAAQSVLRKIDAETYWAGDPAKRRLHEARKRLAYAASYHARLAEDSSLNALPWDLLEKIQLRLTEDKVGCCPQGAAFRFHDETWIMLRFTPAGGFTPVSASSRSPAMLIARRGAKGLTAFRTARSLLIAVADLNASQKHVHGEATYDLGRLADHMSEHGL